MQDVETAIGKHDLLAFGARIFYRGEQLLERHYPTLGTFLALHCSAQFRGADAGGAQLADHDTGGKIGQCDRLRQLLSSSNGRR